MSDNNFLYGDDLEAILHILDEEISDDFVDESKKEEKISEKVNIRTYIIVYIIEKNVYLY